MSEAHDRDFRPALRFRALTPVFDLAVRVARGPEVKRRLLDVLELPPRAEVLDLGSGTGTLAIDLKRRRPDARVTGADADPEIVSIARRKAADAAVDVQFHEADATAMPFADASFDAVVSTLFFHHLDRHAKRAALSEVARVLRPGGALYVGDYGRARDPLQAGLFLVVRALDGFGVTRENARGELPGLAAAAGLADVRVHDALRTPIGTLELFAARRPA